jgi:hypothetical protein
LLFAGSTALAAYCLVGTTPDDAGAGANDGGFAPSVLTLSAFSGSSFTQKNLVSDPQLVVYSVDSAGTQALVSLASGLAVYPLSGAASTVVDSTGVSGSFTSDAMNVVYTSNAPALRRSPVASPAPLTLTPGLAGLLSLSPDSQWALAYKTSGNNGATYDVNLASAVTPGEAIPLAAKPTAGIYGDAFTADSKYAMYLDNIDLMHSTGDFYAAPSTGGTPAKVTTGAWAAVAASGSKVIFNDNCTGCAYNPTVGLTIGNADLKAVDVSSPTAITTLAHQAYGTFFLNAAKDTVAYSWGCTKDGTGGVYASPIP